MATLKYHNQTHTLIDTPNARLADDCPTDVTGPCVACDPNDTPENFTVTFSGVVPCIPTTGDINNTWILPRTDLEPIDIDDGPPPGGLTAHISNSCIWAVATSVIFTNGSRIWAILRLDGGFSQVTARAYWTTNGDAHTGEMFESGGATPPNVCASPIDTGNEFTGCPVPFSFLLHWGFGGFANIVPGP